MNQDVLSSRHQDSPLARRSRDISPPTNNCLEVQWRFLQHKNPKPPQFGSPTRRPLPQIFFNNNTLSKHSEHTQSKAPPGSPSRLFQMFETQDVESEEPNPTITSQTQQNSSNISESRANRTLNDLMGETQRKAMLDRILADMEYLAVEPTYTRLGQPEDTKTLRNSQRARSHKASILQTDESKDKAEPRNRKFTALWSLGSLAYFSDDDDDDSLDGLNGSQTDRTGCDLERKRRQRRKVQQLNQQDEGPRIFWQKTTGAKSAVDVPERLLTLTPSPPHRMRSSQHIVLGRRSQAPRQHPSTSTIISDRRRSNDSRSTSPQQAPKTAVSRRRQNLRTPALASPPSSPGKAHYGAWYVPQSEWWTLHQMEQQTITDKFPALVAPGNADTDENNCHGSPTQRQHKPPLPLAALSPRSHETVAAQAISNGTSRTPSASSHSGALPSAPLELQVASIPQSYIGREYRAYIVSTGSTMPQYLQ